MTYTVTLHLSHADDATCSSPFVDAPVAQLETNAAGNGEADAVFTPEGIDALGVHNSTLHVYFTLGTGGTVAYTTSCLTAQTRLTEASCGGTGGLPVPRGRSLTTLRCACSKVAS